METAIAELALKGLASGVDAVLAWLDAINSGADLRVRQKAQAEVERLLQALSGLPKREADEQAELDAAVPQKP